jgi:hypothetical protein
MTAVMARTRTGSASAITVGRSAAMVGRSVTRI